MKKLYYKNDKGEFIEYGYETDTLPDGIWFIQTKEHSKSRTSLVYQIGDVPKVDVQKYMEIGKYQDDLSRYLMSLSDEESPEYKEARQRLGGYAARPLRLGNWTFTDLSQMIIRQLFKMMNNE